MIPDQDLVQAMTLERVMTQGGHLLPKQVSWPCERARAEEYLTGKMRAEWELRPYPSCLVCGAVGYDAGTNRCYKHRGRTPCAVEGCTKSRKFDRAYDAATWVCGIHWREVCPPRSPLRRTYLRFFRIARKLGVEKSRWPDDLERRYWRFFTGMIARYHRRVSGEGFVDEAEINKLFGWDE